MLHGTLVPVSPCTVRAALETAPEGTWPIKPSACLGHCVRRAPGVQTVVHVSVSVTAASCAPYCNCFSSVSVRSLRWFCLNYLLARCSTCLSDAGQTQSATHQYGVLHSGGLRSQPCILGSVMQSQTPHSLTATIMHLVSTTSPQCSWVMVDSPSLLVAAVVPCSSQPGPALALHTFWSCKLPANVSDTCIATCVQSAPDSRLGAPVARCDFGGQWSKVTGACIPPPRPSRLVK